MRSKVQAISLTAAGAFLLLGFQNCAPVNFGAEYASKGESISGLDEDNLPGQLPDPIVDNNPPRPNQPSQPNQPGNQTNNPPPSPEDEKPPGYVDPIHIPDDSSGNPSGESAQKYRKVCDDARKNGAFQLNADAKIEKSILAKFVAKAPSIEKISKNLAGLIVVYHDGQGSGLIRKVEKNIAVTVACGMDVDSYEKNLGVLVVVDGHVEKVDKSMGMVYLVNSSLGSVSKSLLGVRVRQLK